MLVVRGYFNDVFYLLTEELIKKIQVHFNIFVTDETYFEIF